jgi:hypothetical protein
MSLHPLHVVSALGLVLGGLFGTGQAEGPPVDRPGDTLPAPAVTRLGTLRFHHGGEISSLAYSLDGKLDRSNR